MKNLVVSLVFLFFLTGSYAFAEGPIKIGVLAKRGNEKTIEKWNAHAQYLSEELGMTFEIFPLRFIFVDTAVSLKKVDFLLVNSSLFQTMKTKYRIQEIATMINKSETNQVTPNFGGVIFTRSSNADINNLHDVQGKDFFAVKENSFGGYQMALMEFQDNGIDLPSVSRKISFAGTHDKVVLNVLNFPNRIGTVRTDTLERMAAEGTINMSDIKVLNKREGLDFPFLHSTKLYPEWPVAKLESTDSELARKVAKALINMPENSFAAKSAKIKGWTYPADYNAVEELMVKLNIL